MIRSLGLKLSRVVIDAGHGGHDVGSIGPTGFTEKELVLDLAKRLKTLIETQMGAEVVLTRDADTFVALETRTQRANQEKADLFISIHANSSPEKDVRGVETFFLNLNTQSRDALATATRENAASEMKIHELQDLLQKIVLNDKADESRELAKHVQNGNEHPHQCGIEPRRETSSLCRSDRGGHAFHPRGSQLHQQSRGRKAAENSRLSAEDC